MFGYYVTLKQLILRFILCAIGLTLCVYALPATMTPDQIEAEVMQINGGQNTEGHGDVGRELEIKYNIKKFRDWRWVCGDRAELAGNLLTASGYNWRYAYQPNHVYIEWKDGNCWVPMFKNVDRLAQIEDSLKKLRRDGR
jgi:hypothetical protein